MADDQTQTQTQTQKQKPGQKTDPKGDVRSDAGHGAEPVEASRSAAAAPAHYFEVVQARSKTGRPDTQKRTLLGLGLRRMGQSVALADTPAIRGMIYKVVHLVTVSRKTGPMPLSSRARRRAAESSKHSAS